ncbi:MAG: DUF3298 domain-containing protein [Candidatus Hydrogenedentes bacterium]|nr:DUF3298 domain-containing protein [Candidatus Hydrogenedentota bacterium]
MRLLTALLVITAPVVASANDGGFSYHAGAIDGKYPIQMTLSRSFSDMMGSYFYLSKGEIIDLEGTVEDEAVVLTETVEGKETGVFRGTFGENGTTLEGTWSTPDGAKEMPFRVERFGYQYLEERQLRIKDQPISISMGYPVFEWGGGAKEQALNGLVTDWIHLREKGFVNDATEMIAPDFHAEYSIDIGADVLYFSRDGFASVLFYVYTYTGGAHGMTTYAALNVSLRGDAATAVSLSDLFTPDGLKKLSDACIADLKKQEASGVVDGGVDSLDADALSDFTLSPRGITIYFEPYAVASYAEGPFEVTIAFDSLANELKPDALKGTGLLNDD